MGAFLASSLFLAALLAATTAIVYPVLLRSTIDPALSLTVANAPAPLHGLRVALAWWLVGSPIALSYFVYLFRSFRGKVDAGGGSGH